MPRREYSREYVFKGNLYEAGNMICRVCGERIDSQTQDFMVSKRNTKGGGWEYVTRHRACVIQQSGWEAIEREMEEREQRIKNVLSDFSKYKDKDGEYSDEFWVALDRIGVFDD